MSNENSSSPKQMIPFVILSLSVIALLVWLLMAIDSMQSRITEARQPAESSATTATLNQFLELQIKMLAGQHIDLEASKRKLDEFVVTNMPRLEDQVKKSKKVQSGLEKLVTDLLELAKTDPDAKSLVVKYNIQQNATPTENKVP